MYKELTKKDWYKLLKFPEDKKVDAIIVSGVALANRDREIGFLEQALSNYKDVKKVEYIQDNFSYYRIGNQCVRVQRDMLLHILHQTILVYLQSQIHIWKRRNYLVYI